MGQAFDHEGNVLGEAFGNTKREVFEKLHAEHADAHEIRISSLMKKVQHEVGEDKSLSQRVAELEMADDELRAIAATLWLNYGDTTHNKAGFVISKDTPMKMLLEVLERLTPKT